MFGNSLREFPMETIRRVTNQEKYCFYSYFHHLPSGQHSQHIFSRSPVDSFSPRQRHYKVQCLKLNSFVPSSESSADHNKLLLTAA